MARVVAALSVPNMHCTVPNMQGHTAPVTG